jgi:hypothetical protein
MVGTDFQRKVYLDLETFLEDEELDDKFEVVNLGRKESILPSGKSVSPDVIIRVRESGEIRLRFGCKTSLRERWKQDDRDAMLCGPDIPWVEMTEEEKPKSSTDAIRKKCASIKKNSSFAFVVSMFDRDGMNKMKKALLELLVSNKSFAALQESFLTETNASLHP